MTQTETNWLHSGKYLPRFLRDFHDQKSVFKWIGERVEAARQKRKANGEHDYIEGVNWVAAHVYVIDNFLWFMGPWSLWTTRGTTTPHSQHNRVALFGTPKK